MTAGQSRISSILSHFIGKRGDKMRACALCLLAFMACVEIARPAWAEPPQKPVEEIVEPQPLAIGSRFFTKQSMPRGYQVYYTHMGFEGGYLKVKYERYYHYDKLEESEILTLPLDTSKTALMSTRPCYGETAGTTTKLLIAVVDDFGRITVQKIK